MAVHANAFGMFSKMEQMNFVFLVQAGDAYVPDAKPSTFLQRLHSRLTFLIPPKQARSAPLTSGAICMGSVESAALFPSKRARETVMAIQATETVKNANHSLHLG